eukprot:GILI01062161.1.p2 GENE.GILI01062161.1~~GILI01062161.1.p2  ORF type:complete len:102 (+),score=7.19 GILI01062161.1:48-353(+)
MDGLKSATGQSGFELEETTTTSSFKESSTKRSPAANHSDSRGLDWQGHISEAFPERNSPRSTTMRRNTKASSTRRRVGPFIPSTSPVLTAPLFTPAYGSEQ